MSTPLEAWLENAKSNPDHIYGEVTVKEYDQAIAVIEVLKEALEDIVKSKALMEAPLYNYCESIPNAHEALAIDQEKL